MPDDAVKIIENIAKFMESTNQILARQQLEIDNLRIDIEKIKKHYKNNGKRIINV